MSAYRAWGTVGDVKNKGNKQMKKLMMAFAVVACAMAVQASNYNWKCAYATYEAGSTTKTLNGQTAYLFDAKAYSQSTLFQALFVDKTYATVAAAFAAKGVTTAPTATIADTGKISTSADFAYAGESAGTTWNAYYVVVDGDNIFISGNSKDVTASTMDDPEAIAFTSANTKTLSQAAAMDASKGYKGGGWYTAVPEPTSGLLLLIGMAGLALRRRRV